MHLNQFRETVVEKLDSWGKESIFVIAHAESLLEKVINFERKLFFLFLPPTVKSSAASFLIYIFSASFSSSSWKRIFWLGKRSSTAESQMQETCFFPSWFSFFVILLIWTRLVKSNSLRLEVAAKMKKKNAWDVGVDLLVIAQLVCKQQ